MYQQQELLSKLIIFCIQDDGKSRQKWVRFHFQPQLLRGFTIHLKVALRTLGGIQQGCCPGTVVCAAYQLEFRILSVRIDTGGLVCCLLGFFFFK